MMLAVYLPNMSNSNIAASLNNLRFLDEALGKLYLVLEKHELSLRMYRTIFEHAIPSPQVARPLSNIGLLYQSLGKLDKDLEKHKQSLKMKHEIYWPNKPHCETAISIKHG